ncbi:hypothetical protein EW026_g2117 [Hermanssonia centrifuga]|uniref:Cytochrome c oxidase subunit 8, mitochondrial n=1 Tax=Hermanssonia centrifuga TaxID=98765 RepID=A0A4S4KQ89_9APHY|nr:hypothetical protein EW026_g2117 [Hermanssonia centrifuga]
MSMLVRAPLRQVAAHRFAAPSRGVHGEYKHIPFDYSNRRTFGLKVATYLISGFSIPFVAAWFQMQKSSGSA